MAGGGVALGMNMGDQGQGMIASFELVAHLGKKGTLV